MRCPRCLQNFYQAADSCPHCGYTHADADRLFGDETVALKKLTDDAGILRMKDREIIRRELNDFEKKFPQLFFAVYAEALEDATQLRQYGFWLLNHAQFDDVEENRPNECGILLTIDVNAKSLGMTYGYSLQPYLDEESSFEILSAAHASLLEGKWAEALTLILQRTTRHLKKKHAEAKRDPEGILEACGQRLRILDEDEKPARRSLRNFLQKKEVRE